MNNTLVVLLGPTAVGKTELSIRLAKLLSCDIISADSRQIYKEIDIGTAKPTKEELQEVKHHFIDILPLDQYYSAAQYETDALALISSQAATQPYQLMVGGSMMYIDAVTKGIDDIPTIEDETREEMRRKFETEGLDALCAELRLLDPEYYDLVDKKNHKRIVHALEICYQTGRTYTSFRKNQTKERPFRIIKIGLRRERDNLFARINARVDQMMQQGLMDEVRRVYPRRELNSLNTVGYKELFKVLDGEWELTMAVERMKKNTRVYAKKQMTWFAHDTDIHWIDVDKLNIEQQIQQISALLESNTE
jgi:tRNA dimethylallyltransferase